MFLSQTCKLTTKEDSGQKQWNRSQRNVKNFTYTAKYELFFCKCGRLQDKKTPSLPKTIRNHLQKCPKSRNPLPPALCGRHK